MSDTTAIEAQADLAHQDHPVEIRVFKHGTQALVVRDWHEPARLYKTAGETTDYDEMVAHDGPVLVKGRFREIIDNDGLLEAHHPYGGRMEYVGPDDTVDVPAVLLTEVPRIDD